MVESLISYIQSTASYAEQNYHVNPWLFIVLFFGSAIPLYLGYFLIGRSAVKIDGYKLKRRGKVNISELKLGVAVACGAWILPYLYVVLFGTLPMEIWIIFSIFVLIMAIFFVQGLRSKVIDTKKKAE